MAYKKSWALRLNFFYSGFGLSCGVRLYFWGCRSINENQNSCNVYDEVAFSAQNNVLLVQILSSGKYAGVFFWICQRLSNVRLTWLPGKCWYKGSVKGPFLWGGRRRTNVVGVARHRHLFAPQCDGLILKQKALNILMWIVSCFFKRLKYVCQDVSQE